MMTQKNLKTTHKNLFKSLFFLTQCEKFKNTNENVFNSSIKSQIKQDKRTCLFIGTLFLLVVFGYIAEHYICW